MKNTFTNTLNTLKVGEKAYIHQGEFEGCFARIVKINLSNACETGILSYISYVYTRRGTILYEISPFNISIYKKIIL